jgi:uncharacterized protein involved in outer membrane biogenesis
MKIVKIIGGLVAVLVLVVVGAAVFLWSNLDSIVEQVMEEQGTKVTQTKVDVDGVKLELTSGKGSIKGIGIDAPAGFSRPQIFTLDKISVAVDPKTVTKDVVVIDKIHVEAPQIFYEIDKNGLANLDVLSKNINDFASKFKKAGGGESSASEPSKPGKEVKLIIRKLIIDKTEVDARIAALGNKDISANLPRIELNNLGQSQGGASPAEIAQQVSSVLIKKVSKAIADKGMQQYLGKNVEEVKAELKTKAESQVKEKLDEQLGDKLGGSGLEGLFSK